MEIIIVIAIIKFLIATITIILMMLSTHLPPKKDSECENITIIATIVSSIIILLTLIEMFLL